MTRFIRILLVIPFILGLFSLLVGAAIGERNASSEIHVLRVDGTIVPVMQDYIDRGITKAEEENAAAVVIDLNTPGGLLDTTENIVDRILEARVPVVVYVNRWAGSAGTFITMASHVAAMSPGSRIGAATPVSGEGEELPETYQKKITEDTAAHIRGLANMRGRNQEAAVATVAEALSFTGKEALGIEPLTDAHKEVLETEKGYLDPPLVELYAKDLDSLIGKIDGVQVEVGGEEITINTEGYHKNANDMNFIERFLLAISNPNIAYILLSIGSLGIIFELSSPGTFVPGITGALSLLMGFYSLSILNAYWAGILLVFLAFALFIAEVFTTTFGILTAGGIVSMIAGALILFSGGPSAFSLNVDWWVIAVVVIGVVAFFVFAIQAVVRTQRGKQPTGADGLTGMTAEVRTTLDPKGIVFIHGELWQAILDEGQAEPGEEVIVKEVDGLKLKVSKKGE